MITEDYCSYEVAKLLKEKGFDEHCWKLYELGDCDIPVLLNGFELSEESSFWNNKYLELYKKEHSYINDICSAPTHQMAMKWLREVRSIAIEPMLLSNGWFCQIERILEDFCKEYIDETDSYKTYEESVESAIKYCLENLI
jgi:hypothetical protein